jgi:hypothetical protein
MKREIHLSEGLHSVLKMHLFQNDLEQAAFLFCQYEETEDSIIMRPVEIYTVPAQAWDVQLDIYLQMSDAERGKILKMARDKRLALIDCHSHPHSNSDVWFSPSDVAGITEFAAYVKWKLNGKPFAAIVWGEQSMDSVMWSGDFAVASALDGLRVVGGEATNLKPTGSWFRRAKGKNRYEFES